MWILVNGEESLHLGDASHYGSKGEKSLLLKVVTAGMLKLLSDDENYCEANVSELSGLYRDMDCPKKACTV